MVEFLTTVALGVSATVLLVYLAVAFLARAQANGFLASTLNTILVLVVFAGAAMLLHIFLFGGSEVVTFVSIVVTLTSVIIARIRWHACEERKGNS